MDKNKIRRKLKGVVKSNKMDKTIVVTVTTSKKHPKYHKYYKSSKSYKVHDENNEYQEGDSVVIEESRPLSKEKRWVAKEMISKAEVKEEIDDEKELNS